VVVPVQLVIRPADPDEGETVGAFTEQVYRDGGFAGDGYAAVLRDGARRVREAVVLVAVLDGRLVGSVTVATPRTAYANIARDDELEVRMLAVAPDVRRQGIAGRLMDAAEARAAKLGLRKVVLSTDPGMREAHRLYERRGYVRQPERDWETVVKPNISAPKRE
jgi:ribosomal protein S18 acetylase RimI-like enzyme